MTGRGTPIGRCAVCGAPAYRFTDMPIVGLCTDCSRAVQRAARRRGTPLEDAAAREMRVNGVCLWWWRGVWRVDHVVRATSRSVVVKDSWGVDRVVGGF